MKVNTAISLMECYGKDMTLGGLVKKIQGNKTHKCPKCNGTGSIRKQIQAEVWGYRDARYGYVECNLCNGDGYTEHEYKPKMEQVGWE